MYHYKDVRRVKLGQAGFGNSVTIETFITTTCCDLATKVSKALFFEKEAIRSGWGN